MSAKRLRDFENDPKWIARQAESKRMASLAEERDRQSLAEQVPLLQALAHVGFQVDSVWDLVNSPGPYKEAIPVLLEHLKKPYMDWTRNGIARSLAVYDSECIWSQLVELYRNEPSLIVETGKTSQTKSGLAAAVAAATTEMNIPVLIELARDRSNGTSRLLLLRRLRRSKNPVAKQALEDLANDPDLEKEIASWRRKSGKP